MPTVIAVNLSEAKDPCICTGNYAKDAIILNEARSASAVEGPRICLFFVIPVGNPHLLSLAIPDRSAFPEPPYFN